MPPVLASQSSTATGVPGDDKSASSNNEYEEALEKLQPLQPILRGFNHRNRNQHRRAAWWAPFGMLRRHLDKLVDELFDAAAAAAAATKSKSKKRKRIDDSDDRAERKTRDHVKWLRDILVPKCYLAFSQLTADNQFAALGVVLLGTLAQVNAVCVRLTGEAVAADGGGGGGSSVCGLSNSATAAKDSGNSADKNPASETPSQIGGAVVSRDEVARAEKLRKKNALLERGQTESSRVPATARTDMGHNDDATSTEKRHGAGSKTQNEEIDNTSSKEGLKQVKKKKKTKKRGDEFDNLFKDLF